MLVMRSRPGRPLLRALAGHLAMGAALGTSLALLLFFSNTRNISTMLVNGSTPRLATMVFIAIFASVIAVGASITGLIFASMDDE